MRNIKFIEGLPFSLNQIQDITDTLVRKTTGEWEPDRTVDQIKRISVHHSAVEGASIESYANYHVNQLGWRSIGYHVVVKGSQTYETNNLLSFTYHTSGQNQDTVSVSVSGDLSKRPLSEDERNNLYGVVLTYMNLFSIPVENVLGHREFEGQNTACPCIDMDQVRSDVKTLQMKMQQQDTWEDKLKKISEIGNQYNFMTGKIKDGPTSGDAQWAMNNLLSVRDIMLEQKLL